MMSLPYKPPYVYCNDGEVKRSECHSVIFPSNSEWSPVLAKNVRVAKYTRRSRHEGHVYVLLA